ncbi:MAG: hypothetical protein AB7G28_20965 [Pirellulales bacterium]
MITSRLGWTIKFLLGVLFLSTAKELASAETLRFVTPPSAGATEGEASVSPTRDPLRIQYLIPASDFAGLPESHRYIVAFNFRSDHTQTQSIDWPAPHERAWMSTTSQSSLSEVFDDNHGSDKTLVYDGPMTFSLLGSGPVDGPREFSDGTLLHTPFYYDPTHGNLLVELQDFDKNFPEPAVIDLVTIPGSDIRTLLNIGNASAATGVLVPNIVTPIRFEFAVPEPSVLQLIVLTLLYPSSGRRRFAGISMR